MSNEQYILACVGVDAREHLLSKPTADDEQAARMQREQARAHLRLRALASGAGPTRLLRAFPIPTLLMR